MTSANDLGVLATERAGSGSPIAFLHGSNQTARSWRRVSALLAMSHEVIAVDAPYHGCSATIAARDISEYADLAGKTVGRATYVGYYDGARAAIELALRNPEVVEGLVLMGTCTEGPSTEETATRRQEDLELAERLEGPEGPDIFEAHIRRRLARPDFHLDPEGQEVELAANHENSSATLASFLRAIGRTGNVPSRYERLAELEMPVLVLWGEHAPPYDEYAKTIADQIGANATVAMLPGAGHPLPFERPKEFVELLTDWVGRIHGNATGASAP